MPLRPEQVHLFRYNGFLKLPGQLPDEIVESLKGAVLDDIRNEVEPVVKDREGRITRISFIWERGGVFRELINSPVILDSIESLLGPNIEFIRNRHNHSTLRLGGQESVYLHRDVLQWTRNIVSVIVYLEESNLENGSTQIVPGSHLLPGIEGNSFKGNEQLERSGVLDQMVAVPMPAGGLLAIDSMIIHGAGPNHSAGTRMSITLGYHSVDELLDVENEKRVLVRGERVYGGNDLGVKKPRDYT